MTIIKLIRAIFVTQAAWLCPAIAGAGGANEQPNILFIIADDLGARLGCYDDPVAVTPHLDRLGAQGVVFRNCFTQFATCGPSRASMLSGLYPYQTGITNNGKRIEESAATFTTLPRLFRKNGYTTARVGKIFHMGIPGDIGTPGHDEPGAWDITCNNTGWDAIPGNYETAHQHGDRRGFGVRLSWLDPDIPNASMADGTGTRAALQMMDQYHPEKTGKPLMLFMGYYRPHPPMISPRSSWKAIDPVTIQLPFVPENDRDDIPEINFHLQEEAFNFIPEAVGKSYTHAYYAAVHFIDSEVGKLLSGLCGRGLDRNTIIVFTGDQGFHLGEHGHWHKSTFFEEASRVPLIIVDPRNGINGTTFSLCGLIDVYPTLCELVGIPPEHKLSGKSLLPILRKPGLSRSEPVLTQGNPGGTSIRTERYRYTQWQDGDKGSMLYDLVKDPREITNLVTDPDYQEIKSDLVEQLNRLLGK